MTKLRGTLLALIGALLLGGALLLPTQQAHAMGGSITSIVRQGCLITVNFNATAAGTYYLVVYDDGFIVDTDMVTVGGPGPLQLFHLILNPAGTGAPGIGLLVQDAPGFAGMSFGGQDPYLYPDDVANNCADSDGADSGDGITPPIVRTLASTCRYPVPSGSVVGDVPAGAQAHWAPGSIAPGVVLNPGTYWVIGQDASETYYKVQLTCQAPYLWIRKDTAGPSFQAPQNGAALPTRIVD